jgi:hypothetical protein
MRVSRSVLTAAIAAATLTGVVSGHPSPQPGAGPVVLASEVTPLHAQAGIGGPGDPIDPNNPNDPSSDWPWSMFGSGHGSGSSG